MTAILLALAQLCVSESGFRAADDDAHDCAAIFYVIRSRSRSARITWLATAHAYSPRVFRESRAGSRPYLPHLRLDGREPRGWPSTHGPWRHYRPRWRRILEHSQDIVRGRVSNPCPGARHWGMATGEEYRRPREVYGWRQVTCTRPTLNAFWSVPRGRGRRPGR